MTAQSVREIILSLQGLTVSFGGLRALSNVSVDVVRGGVTSLIGPNGAGKSTLFNVVSGAIRPALGRVYLRGTDVTGLSPDLMQARGLARSFQITNLFPKCTVFENLRLAAQILERPGRAFLPPRQSKRAVHKVQMLIEQFGLSESANQLAGELSHGEQRRLEIAVALACEPEILLLDEPTQGMSHADTEEVKALILALSKDVTILLIEHDIDLVMELSRWVVVLHQGSKIAEGMPSQVRANRDVRMAYFGDH